MTILNFVIITNNFENSFPTTTIIIKSGFLVGLVFSKPFHVQSIILDTSIFISPNFIHFFIHSFIIKRLFPLSRGFIFHLFTSFLSNFLHFFSGFPGFFQRLLKKFQVL